MIPEAIFAIWLLSVGAALGSFMAAFADRLETGNEWHLGRSMCNGCNRQIPGSDLIPLVSYLTLRRRCRRCGRSIPRRLWFAELAGFAAAGLALLLMDTVAMQISSTIFLLLLLGLFLTDLQSRRLPDTFTAALAAAGLWVGSNWHGLAFGALAAMIGVAVFWAIAIAYRRIRGHDGLGMGDVKMMAGLSAVAGPLGIPWLTLLAASSALITAAVQRTPIHSQNEIPLGCFLAISGALIWALQAIGLF